jgi:hypothetical protein
MNQKNHQMRQPLSLIIRNNSDKPQTAYVLGGTETYPKNNEHISISLEQPGKKSKKMYQELIFQMNAFMLNWKIEKTMIWCDPFDESGNQKFPYRLQTIELCERTYSYIRFARLHFRNKYLVNKNGRNNKIYILNGMHHFIIKMPPNYCIRLELYPSLESHHKNITNNNYNPSTMKSKPQTTVKPKTTAKAKATTTTTKTSSADSGNKISREAIQNIIKMERIPNEADYSMQIMVTAKNASDRTKSIKLFNGDTKSSGNHELVHVFVSGEDSSKGYDDIMSEIKDKDIHIRMLYISSGNMLKTMETMPAILIRYRKNNRIAKKISLTMDPYQQQISIICTKGDFNLNKNVYVEIMLKGDDRVSLYFYPDKVSDNKK